MCSQTKCWRLSRAQVPAGGAAAVRVVAAESACSANQTHAASSLGSAAHRHRACGLRLQPAQPRLRLHPGPAAPQLPGAAQAPLPHDHARAGHGPRGQPVRGVWRDGRLPAAAGAAAGALRRWQWLHVTTLHCSACGPWRQVSKYPTVVIMVDCDEPFAQCNPWLGLGFRG